MIMRILFWIALLVLVVMAVRSKLRALAPKPDAAARGQEGGGGDGGGEAGREGEAMACCAHCHVYFPASEAVRADGEAYCSAAHLRLPPL